MKFLLVLFVAFASVFAQTIRIDAPPEGSTLTPGKKFTAKLTLLPELSSLRQVSVAIGLRHCLTMSPCNPDVILGDILHQGPYNPMNHGSGLSYQNFKLTVPSGTPSGEAMLSVAHFYLIGAENIPQLNVTGITVNIA